MEQFLNPPFDTVVGAFDHERVLPLCNGPAIEGARFEHALFRWMQTARLGDWRPGGMFVLYRASYDGEEGVVVDVHMWKDMGFGFHSARLIKTGSEFGITNLDDVEGFPSWVK